MEDFKSKLIQHKKLSDEIFKAFFGGNSGYGDLDINLDLAWRNDNDNLLWRENNTVFACEIMREYTYQNFIMFYIDTGCGEKYYKIFDINLMDPELESD